MQQLMPPQHGPGRPSSAPPPQMRPHFQGHPPMPMGQGRPPQTQSWPVQARPPTQAEAAQYYNHNPPQPNLPNPSTYPGPPPLGPGHMQHAPTMYFDTRTGKWQSNMLPPEMQPQAQGGKRSLSNVGLESEGQRNMSTPQLVQPAPHPLAREDSYSSASSTSSTDDDLAYGKVYEKKRPPRRVLSHERGRPHELANTSRPMQSGPVELDWYATQSQKKPVMAQAIMNREGRAATLPTQMQQYSASQPNLAVFEMDGTGVSPNARTASPRPQHGTMELDSRDTERYRAFHGTNSSQSDHYKAYRPQ